MTPAGATARPLTIVVCTKFTVDVNQLSTDPATGRPNLARAPYRINNFDENAIEGAVRLKEKHGGRVVAVSLIAQEPPRDVLLRGLAMGVDTVFLVKDGTGVVGDAFTTATILAAAIQQLSVSHKLGSWDLIICGDASVDEYNGQVGPRLAEALGIPSVTYATRLAVQGNSLIADRTMEDQVETVEAPLPALVTVGMETNQPRMPTVLQIMGAGRKPVVQLSLADIGRPDHAQATLVPRLKTQDISAPPSARKHVVVEGEGPDDVARKLLRHLGEVGEVKF